MLTGKEVAEILGRFLLVGFATIGIMTVGSAATKFVTERSSKEFSGVVLGIDKMPKAKVPVFLDRGGFAIERFVTDSAGRFTLPLDARERRRASWLICSPGAVPIVAFGAENQVRSATYPFTELYGPTYGYYRASGWRGPIPRECPTGTDTLGWRYPASAGRPNDISNVEPEWPR
ncbi:MAG: hypothetical protein V4550_19305 [Gemmatimonadota bacterium]